MRKFLIIDGIICEYQTSDRSEITAAPYRARLIQAINDVYRWAWQESSSYKHCAASVLDSMELLLAKPQYFTSGHGWQIAQNFRLANGISKQGSIVDIWDKKEREVLEAEVREKDMQGA